MKQSLHLGLSQNLRMTPQLQQAIRLLQLSSLDLQQEIQECLYSNPLLEAEEPADEAEEAKDQIAEQPVEIADRGEQFDFSAMESMSRNQMSGGAELPEQDDAVEETLQDYLRWQLNMAGMSRLDQMIGEAIIDSIDTSGALTSSLDEITESVDWSGEAIEPEDALFVLHAIQRFDPPGVGYRDLRECLQIQLAMLPETGAVETAMDLVERQLENLSRIGLQGVAKKLKRPIEEIDEAYELIKSLNPRPGYGFSGDRPDYILPDLALNKVEGRWQVSLNRQATPRVKLNESYAGLVKGSEPQTRDYLRTNLQEAKWLLRSLESRNDTLLRVGQAIVEYQRDFFEHGEEAMKPLVLRELAEKLELHESTISRATSQKYIASPRGVFELKYFFSSQLTNQAGTECSSTAIRALINRTVKQENPAKPLSDSALVQELEKQGVVVARRTIAKYREMLGIPSSNERKRLISS